MYSSLNAFVVFTDQCSRIESRQKLFPLWGTIGFHSRLESFEFAALKQEAEEIFNIVHGEPLRISLVEIIDETFTRPKIGVSYSLW